MKVIGSIIFMVLGLLGLILFVNLPSEIAAVVAYRLVFLIMPIIFFVLSTTLLLKD